MCLSLSFFHLFTFSSISTLILKERAYFTYVNPFLSVSTLHYYKVRINELVFWIPDNCLYIPHSIVLCYRLKWNIAVQEKKKCQLHLQDLPYPTATSSPSLIAEPIVIIITILCISSTALVFFFFFSFLSLLHKRNNNRLNSFYLL